MLGFYLRTRSSVKPHLPKLGLAAWIVAIAVIAAPAPAWAQAACSTSGLNRDGDSQRRLAVQVDGEWEFFSRNADGPAHLLPVDRQSAALCMAWEAPARPGLLAVLSRQFVYVSTRYTTNQPLSLFRSGGFPLLTALDWGDGRGRGQADAVADDFRSYHEDRSSIQGALARDLNRWHDGNATYSLVSGALTSSVRLPNGAERLLTLLSRRPRKSWVRIVSQVPAVGDTLRVAVAYSEDANDLGPHAYEFIFEIN